MSPEKIVAMALANQAGLDGTIWPVADICRSVDIVFGVWADNTRPCGYDMIVVKGLRRLNAIAGVPDDLPAADVRALFGYGAELGISAVLCTCYDQAFVLQAACGEHQRGPMLS